MISHESSEVVTGHGLDAVRALLARSHGANAFPQTLLLTGTTGVGKADLALWTAQLVLCSDPDQRPCGSCRACRLVVERGHPDLHWHGAGLKIDAVRELQRQIVLSPTETDYRVAVIVDIESATPAASNALLKTLEEPPEHVMLLLTSSSVSDVLPTIRSRSQLVRVPGLGIAEVQDLLERQLRQDAAPTVPGEPRLIAALAGGRSAWALSALYDPEVLSRRDHWLDHLRTCLRAPVHERLEIAESLAGDLVEVLEGLGYWLSWARDVLWLTTDPQAEIANLDRRDELDAAAASRDPQSAAGLVAAIARAIDRANANVNRQLLLESLVVEIAA